jgi:hypothetical protein
MDESKIVSIRKTSEDISIRSNNKSHSRITPGVLRTRDSFLWYAKCEIQKMTVSFQQHRHCSASTTLRNAAVGFGGVDTNFSLNDRLNEYIFQPTSSPQKVPASIDMK